MPLVKIEIIEGKSSDYKKAIMDGNPSGKS